MTHREQTVLDGKLYNAPIKKPERILDVGTGTGIWAMEMGECNGKALVDGSGC